MDGIQSGQTIVISQRNDWGEAIVGYEASNKYVVSDVHGNDLYYAAEVEGSFVLRAALRSARPFTMIISDRSGARLVSLSRAFHPYLSRLSVYDNSGEEIGTVIQRFSFFKKHYSIIGRDKKVLFEITGPLCRPRTLIIKKNNNDRGIIVKKARTTGTEMLTDGEVCRLTVNSTCDEAEKKVLLGAVFLIACKHFEGKTN